MDKQLSKLGGIPLGRVYQAEIAALARLHLMVTGDLHARLLEFGKQGRGILLEYGEHFDAMQALQAQNQLLSAWHETTLDWTQRFAAARREAATLAFGLLAWQHERYIRPLLSQLSESGGVTDGVFERQISWILDTVENERVDGATLSERIWQLDRVGVEGIQQVIQYGLSEGKSAWEIAEALEVFLGANGKCPRWTDERLRLGKKDIADGNLQGLLSGANCDTSGVAYKALRLARTEIQRVHAAAIDAQMEASPWVEAEKINLSPSHPTRDICDEVAEGGEKGEGIYEVGEIKLPLHPNCLCYKTSEAMSDADFAAKLRGWLQGEGWAAMDDYAALIGGNVAISLAKDAALAALAVWLFGSKNEMEARL